MELGACSSTLAFSRVTIRVRLLQVRVGKLREVLQRVEMLVADQLLHVPEIRAAADELGWPASDCPVGRKNSDRVRPRRRASAVNLRFSAAVRRRAATGMQYRCISDYGVSSGAHPVLVRQRVPCTEMIDSYVHSMATQSVSSLLRLPKRQRLKIAESLWLSVADAEKMPVPEQHRKILDARLASYRSGKSKPIPHDKLMGRLRSS